MRIKGDFFNTAGNHRFYPVSEKIINSFKANDSLSERSITANAVMFIIKKDSSFVASSSF